MLISCTLIRVVVFAEVVLISEVRNACGSGYFIDNNSNQAALVVRGFFCGNSYFYTPIGMGDTISELAYFDQALFTGVAEDYDSSGHVIGRYVFRDGLLQDLEEFMPNGPPTLQLHFEKVTPHGQQRAYNMNGKLELMNTYDHGMFHGPFLSAFYGDFYDCIVKGYAIFGEHHYFQGFEPCYEVDLTED